MFPAPGSTTNRICGPRSNGSEPAIAQPRHTSWFLTGSAPQTHRCCGGWSPQPSASGGWKQKTGSSAEALVLALGEHRAADVRGNGRDTPRKKSAGIIGPC
jgi:hypothetical protein